MTRLAARDHSRRRKQRARMAQDRRNALESTLSSCPQSALTSVWASGVECRLPLAFGSLRPALLPHGWHRRASESGQITCQNRADISLVTNSAGQFPAGQFPRRSPGPRSKLMFVKASHAKRSGIGQREIRIHRDGRRMIVESRDEWSEDFRACRPLGNGIADTTDQLPGSHPWYVSGAMTPSPRFEKMQVAVAALYERNRQKGRAPWCGLDYDFVCPSTGTYPFQWLWDSCFHAVVLAHYDKERARSEIRSLLAN